MKILIQNRGFTLIELMVTITILVIFMGATYMNYAYYQNKMNLKLTSKDISQSLYNARNMAINGLDSASGNVSVGVYFDNSLSTKNKLSFFTYPYDLDIGATDLLDPSKYKVLKEINFYKGIELNDVNGENKFLFLFEAITGKGYYYYWNTNPGKNSFAGDYVDIKISFKGTSSPTLSKKIRYVTGTNIVDY